LLIRVAPQVFGTCRKLSVADCKNVRVHVDAVLLSIEVPPCPREPAHRCLACLSSHRHLFW
jgi:hypothetical protein